MSSNDFQVLVQEVIRDDFIDVIDKIEVKRNNLATKTISLKDTIFNKLVKNKCNKFIKNIEKYGKLTFELGEIKIVDVKDENEELNSSIQNFNECYFQNSLDITKVNQDFSDDIEKNNELFYSNLSSCKGDNPIEVKTCIFNSIKQSTKNLEGILNKYDKIVEEKQNILY